MGGSYRVDPMGNQFSSAPLFCAHTEKSAWVCVAGWKTGTKGVTLKMRAEQESWQNDDDRNL